MRLRRFLAGRPAAPTGRPPSPSADTEAGALVALPRVSAAAGRPRVAWMTGVVAVAALTLDRLASAGADPDARAALTVALVERWTRGQQVPPPEQATAQLAAEQAWQGFKRRLEAEPPGPSLLLGWDVATLALGLVRAAWGPGDGVVAGGDALRAAAMALATLGDPTRPWAERHGAAATEVVRAFRAVA